MSYFWLTLERIPDDLGFSLYDRTHLCWLLGICAGIVLLAWVCRRICEDTCRRLLQGIGWGMLGLEVLKVAVLLSTGQFRAAYLPLDLCGLSVFLEFAAVWKPHPLLLELLYSLSLPGACLALLFPNWFPLPLWNFFSIHSFVIHGDFSGTWDTSSRLETAALLLHYGGSSVYSHCVGESPVSHKLFLSVVADQRFAFDLVRAGVRQLPHWAARTDGTDLDGHVRDSGALPADTPEHCKIVRCKKTVIGCVFRGRPFYV